MLVLKNAKILDLEKEEIKVCQIEISEGIISYIGIEREVDGQVLDVNGGLVSPSFIDLGFNPLERFLFIEDDDYNKKCEQILNEQNIDEKGLETIIKERLTDSVNLGYGYIFCRGALKDKVKPIADEIGINCITVGEENNCDFMFIKNIFDDEKLVGDSIRFSKEKDIPVLFEASKTLQEVGICDIKYKITPIEYAEELGLLDIKNVIFNAIHLDKKDYKILSGRTSVVVSNDNILLENGVASINSFLEENIKVCLEYSNPFREMFSVRLVQAGVIGENDKLKNLDIYKMLTTNIAESFNLNSYKIKVGEKANFIVLNSKNLDFSNIDRDLYYLIANSESKDVLLNICNGNILKNNVSQKFD